MKKLFLFLSLISFGFAQSVPLNNPTLTGTVTAGGSAGTSGYLLQSTGTGVQWAAATITLASGSGSASVSTGGTATFSGGTGISTSATGSTVTITNTGVTSLTASTGISVSGSTGGVTVTNTGVTSAVAGTGVSVSGSTGAVTFSIGQAVATTSAVTFASETISGSSQISSLGVGTAASGTAGEIRATNAITSYYSDDRLKTRNENIQNALGKILSLDGFHYTANETAQALGYDGNKQEVGLSAQQVQAVLPQVVVPAPIDSNYLTIQYERLIPLLVEAIKEQQKQIDELKAKLGN